jgi:hypothetical protein
MHHAGAAEAYAAAKLRAGEFELLPNHPQRGVTDDASTLTDAPFTMNWKAICYRFLPLQTGSLSEHGTNDNDMTRVIRAASFPGSEG